MKSSKTNFDLWKKAKKLIPGGNVFLSKRPELFLPKYWPTYYKKSKGCQIWDLKGRKFFDFSLMGVGTNILGYAYDKIDNEVKKAVDNGNMSSLNSYDEIKLSESLLDIHKWAHMIKFARSGGEANSIAVRIARASTNRQDIAVCGYHGWHDWYLAANLRKKNKLSNYLIKGLLTEGVHNSLANTTYTFIYNDYKSLEKLISNHPSIGIIKMEVSRNYLPNQNYLKKVRQLCNRKKIILIFDECTSGFRETFGGLHKKYKINPDIAVFGKALGNGYAITAVIGKREIMQNSKKSFISSTFWSERIGFVAGYNTLKQMKQIKSWKEISSKGSLIKKNWLKIFSENKYSINISGLNSIPSFLFEKDNSARVTFITQEMLKHNFLAANTIFMSIAHKNLYIKSYLEKLEQTVSLMKKIEDKGIKIKNKIIGPLKSDTFDRLN